MSKISTEIEILLTPEAKAVLDVDWVTLDLRPGFSLREFKDLEGLTDINQILPEAVLGFSVPFSSVNDLAMLPFDSPSIVDNRTIYVECRVRVWGDPRPYDRIYFVEKNYTRQEWELEFRRSSEHWIEKAGQKKVCELPLGTTPFDKATIEASWDLNGGVWDAVLHTGILFPLVDHAGWVDQKEPVQLTDAPLKQVRVEDFRPWLSLPWLLKVGFCEIGWTLNGFILETEFVRRMWTYLLSPTFYKSSKGGDLKLVGRYLAGDINLNTDIPFIDTIDYDAGGNAIIIAGSTAYPGIINETGYDMCYTFRFQGVIVNTGSTQQLHSTLVPMIPSSGPAPWIISGEILAETYTEILAGQTLQVDIQLDVIIKPGDAVAFFPAWADNGINSNIGLTAKKGMYIIVEPCQQTLIRGDVVNVAELINCEYTLLDLFKGFVHAVNGKLLTNWDIRTLTVFPENASNVAGESVEGFIQNDVEPINIESRLVCNSLRRKPIRNQVARYFRLGWAESSDAWIEAQNFQDPPFSRLILNDINLPNKTTDLFNPFFEPTLEAQPDSLMRVSINPFPFLPRLWDNVDGAISYNIGPRLALTFAGSVKQVDPAPGYDAFVFFEAAPTRFFGYVSQKPTWPLVPETGDLFPTDPLIFGNAPNDLFVAFYLGASLLRKRGDALDWLVFIGQREYSNWNFRVPFIFPVDGFPTRAYLQKVRDFASGLELPTPLTFIADPIETQCCDLPCSCRFTMCDFYQDIGIYILQDTLNELQVTSFKVDGKEYVAVPESLGIINVIQLSGKPYVTNLVDTLNSFGVPYFTFGYSTREFVEKGDWRFFSIKYPVCQSFEIIISDSGGEVYRYTNTESLQQWFGGTWSPFSYSGTDFGEPLGCQTVIEY